MENNTIGFVEVIKAIKRDNTEVIEKVLQDENHLDIFEQCNALHRACLSRSARVLDLLLKNNITADINKKKSVGRRKMATPLEIACLKKSSVLMKLLISAGAYPSEKIELDECNKDIYPIHYAAMKLDLNLLQLLVSKGANICKIAKMGYAYRYGRCRSGEIQYRTPLDLAVHHAKEKPSPKDLECIRYLLHASCPNANSSKRFIPPGHLSMPLYFAVKKGWFSAVKLFLEYRADVTYPFSMQTVDFLTPHCVATEFNAIRELSFIHLAILTDNIGILQLLIDHGLSVNEIAFPFTTFDPRESANPLAFACHQRKPHMLEFLLENGALPNETCGRINGTAVYPLQVDGFVTVPNVGWLLAVPFSDLNKSAPKLIPILAKYGTDLNCVEPQTGVRPLELLYIRGRPYGRKIVETYIKHGADVNLQNREGKSLLLSIMSSRNLIDNVSSLAKLIPYIDVIAQHVENFELKDHNGESALFQTVKYCAWDCTYALLKHGASMWAEEWFRQHRNIFDPIAIAFHKRPPIAVSSLRPFQLNNQEEPRDDAYQDSQLQKLYDYFYEHQMTLQFICRAFIRKHLPPPIHASAEKLQIPRCFIEYIIRVT